MWRRRAALVLATTAGLCLLFIVLRQQQTELRNAHAQRPQSRSATAPTSATSTPAASPLRFRAAAGVRVVAADTAHPTAASEPLPPEPTGTSISAPTRSKGSHDHRHRQRQHHRGILVLAIGPDSLRQAMRLLSSLRRPEVEPTVPVTLVVSADTAAALESEPYAHHQLALRLVILPPTPTATAPDPGVALKLAKIRTLALAPYAETLFLDADIVACRPFVDALWTEAGGDADVAMVQPRPLTLANRKPGKPAESKSESDGPAQDLYHFLGLHMFERADSPFASPPADYPYGNSGVLLLRPQRPAVQRLLELWPVVFAWYLQQPERGGKLHDQVALRTALHAAGARLVLLDQSANCRSAYYPRPLAHCGMAVPRAGARDAGRTHAGPQRQHCLLVHAHEASLLSAQVHGETLPNFFTQAPSAERPRYQHNATCKAFVHVAKTAGSSTKTHFIKNVLTRGTGRTPQLVSVVGRMGFEDRFKARVPSPPSPPSTTPSTSSPPRRGAGGSVYAGAFALGMGRLLGMPCAYYVLLRDPIERMISEFHYCHTESKFNDQCCTGRRGREHMRTLTLVEWAQERGNVFLEHLLPLAREDFPAVRPTPAPRSSAAPGNHSLQRLVFPINPIDMRRRRLGPASLADLRVAQQHLERWFAVVGLQERLVDSWTLFAAALLDDAQRARAEPQLNQLLHDQLPHNHAAKNRTPVSDADRAAVAAAVDLDLQLYRTAVDIFERQWQAYQAL